MSNPTVPAAAEGMPAFNRRRFLRALGLTAAVAASGTTVTLASQREPTREDLELYYGILWMEFQALGDELGVGMHDSTTMHKNGNYERLKAAFAGSPPSSRALAILAATGLEGRA